jgi:hypothetical protein
VTTRLLWGKRRIAWALCGQLLVALPASGAPTPAEKAAAEALFQEGTELMSAQSFAAACSKFEASGAIEPGLGVKLWLADCYDHAGRSASAWALFTEAAALAHQSGQVERERAASERATELEARLSKLQLAPPAAGLPAGLVVTLNGVAIPEASLGSALPVDPGVQRVVLEAPGYRTLTLSSEAPAGPSSVTLAVPALERAPAPPRRKVSASAAALTASDPGSTQRMLGYTVGGLGVLSLAGAGLLAYRAHALDQDSRSHCLVSEPNACDVDGASLRGQAQNFGNMATGVLVGGGVLTATGLVLLLTAPHRAEEGSKVRLHAGVTPNGAVLFATGVL